MREGKGECMDMNLLLDMDLLTIIGIAVVYTVLILSVAKCVPQRSTAEGMVPAEIDFVLHKGQTIIGVMDTTEIMCFCVGQVKEHVHDEEDTVN
jgi:hypothetical protein